MKVRLQVILSRAGVASRRGAEVYIKEGRVAVNGKRVTELGSKADPDVDRITVDGDLIGGRQEIATVLLHKPDGVVTTLSDPEKRETVGDLVASEPYRLLPAGRLDFHTEGALLLTTDGELLNRLLHPKHHVPKIYAAKVKGSPSPADIKQLGEGVLLDDGPTRPVIVDVVQASAKHTWLRIVVTEGRNRMVRRMCDFIEHPVIRLVRTEVGTITLGDLKPATYRYLSGNELTRLYRTAGLSTVPQLSTRAQRFGAGAIGKGRRGRGAIPEM